MAVITPARSCRGPRAASRRAFRHPARLPKPPAGVEVLAAVKHARGTLGRVFEWDARLETSAIALLEYLWRRGRGEKWAGRNGSALYACSIAQLVMGLAPIMGWRNIPNRKNEQVVARFVKAHRKSVQRWLDWLALAGLVSHTPQQDEEGFWWRTVIELHGAPELAAELLAEAVERRGGWPDRERRRAARGRQRNLTAVLRRARLSRAERRARSAARRRDLNDRAEHERVRAQVTESLALAVKTHLTQPFGASTTSRSSLEELSQAESFNRGLTSARARLFTSARAAETQTTGSGEGRAESGAELRWAVYDQVMGVRFTSPEASWPTSLTASAHRLRQLEFWDDQRPCPRWRLIEAWTVAAHGADMAAAGGFRLAFWSEDADHHGHRLERALARYRRYATARPPGFPAGAIAAFAQFLAEHAVRQDDGPEHGMAYDVQRFNELTKQMSAYAHYARPDHMERLAARAERRDRVRRVAEQVNARLGFRLPDSTPGARLRSARALLDSDFAPHRQAGRRLYAAAARESRLEERDRRLRAGRHPGDTDGRYRAACAYAARWGLATPAS